MMEGVSCYDTTRKRQEKLFLFSRAFEDNVSMLIDFKVANARALQFLEFVHRHKRLGLTS